MFNNFSALGNWLARHQKLIWGVQWLIILIYILLMVIPIFLPLPDESATLFHHFTVFAGFLFWGIWWPFVLVSIILFGRLWCGVLCPEGALSEFANRFGQGRTIPKWMRWGGWPFVAFGITTIYGQMTSVYQYPKPVLLILGGSTLAAMIIGFLYGKSSRVWCKYLCPVTGVFNLLARLAPWRYQPKPGEWSPDQLQQIKNVRCPTLLPLTKMTGAGNCLMCGKCAIAKNAVELKLRSPHEEIVHQRIKNNPITAAILPKTELTRRGRAGMAEIYDPLLIIFGLCGLAAAAFQWPNSFWFSHFREVLDSWFLVHQVNWVFNSNAPWWIFTHYPERGDVFSWIYGGEIIFYILTVGLGIGGILTTMIIFAVKSAGKLSLARFNHLSQSLIPLGGMNVFIGLFANTLSILQKYANLGFVWINHLKFILLALASIWSLILAYKIIEKFTVSIIRRILSLSLMAMCLVVVNYTWILILTVWSLKSDSIPWNTLWVN